MNGSAEFGYEDAANEAWKNKLYSSFYKLQEHQESHTHCRLKTPNFNVSRTLPENAWANWDKTNETMSFAEKLLRNFEWAAVEYVMKHEIAHMIVSNIFDVSTYGCPHGEMFERACTIMGIDCHRSCSSYTLSTFKGTGDSPMVEKVRKLLIHANDKGATEGEAQVFLAKAHELMARYNIKMQELSGHEKFYIPRPVGPVFKPRPSWFWTLANLIKENYNVEVIRMFGNLKNSCRLEIFGEPSNLDIAEYVYCALLNQGEFLWKQFLKEHKRKCKEDPDYLEGMMRYGTRGRVSKASFLAGLYRSYANKLCQDVQEVHEKIEAEDGKLVPTDDRFLREMFEEYYNPRSTSGGKVRYNSASYNAGSSAGRSLTLAHGVGSAGSRGRLLRA